ncbi:hypothetical protein WOLCODRAFT_162452 [Wolfiporia cocos MD-104 SS10]|uniref:Uncharacterized protein n=1 Tax=Wolfiporia cocos (strain MD-104) TaxID=742152 RepID=A0A2H3JEL7_WOLCO|nr:hypothetical protein WOLCODRAFT_162452 [Wolfiporia cocos MD-104 SS10]
MNSRDLQAWEGAEKPSESDLADFSQLFGTSARRVFFQAAKLKDYADEFHLKISRLNRENFSELLDRAVSAEIDGAIIHDIFVATPSPGNRKKFDLQISTAYLSYMEFLYQGCRRSPLIRLLAKFPNGGERPMTAMKTSAGVRENTHWHSNGLSSPLRYLRLGCPGHMVAIVNDQVDLPVEEFDRLDRYYFSQGDRQTLRSGFYISRAEFQPTFDAFVYDEGPRRATIFKATVSDRHDISTAGLDWLYTCCVKSINLVVAVPPLSGDFVENFQVANSHRDKLGNVYHLELQDLKEVAGSTGREEARSGQSRGPNGQRTDPSDQDTELEHVTSTEMVFTATAARSRKHERLAAAIDNGEVDNPEARLSRQYGALPSSQKPPLKHKRGLTGSTGEAIDESTRPSLRWKKSRRQGC